MTDRPTGFGAPDTIETSERTTLGPAPVSPHTASSAPERPVRQPDAIVAYLATHAAPILREVAARVAETAARAGDAAGPIALKVADMTGSLGVRVADKGRTMATDLRREGTSRPPTAAVAAEAGDRAETLT